MLAIAKGSMVHIYQLDTKHHTQHIQGHFVDPNSTASLKLTWQLDANQQHYQALTIFLKQQPVLFVSSRKNIQKIELVGIARSSETQLDQLVLLASYGDLWDEEIIFIHYHMRTRQFVQYYATSKHTDVHHHPYLRCGKFQHLKQEKKSFQPCQSLWEATSRNAMLGEKIFRELKPIKVLSNRTRGRNILATRLIPTKKMHDSMQQIQRMRDPNFYMEVLDENRRWKILQMSFDDPDKNTWGLLFAFDKQKQQWMSFYALPKSSMVSLFMPMVELVNESTLKLHTCVDCRMWGEKTNIIVNMNTMVAAISPY